MPISAVILITFQKFSMTFEFDRIFQNLYLILLMIILYSNLINSIFNQFYRLLSFVLLAGISSLAGPKSFAQTAGGELSLNLVLRI
jgi:hypothetical protein